MTNELKPCPFCGGEATLNKYGYRYINCPDCFAMTGSTGDVDRLVDNWNTRQPVDNWKPIEELTEEAALKYEDILFYMRNTTDKDYILASVTYDYFTKRTRISSFELDSDFDFEDDVTKIFSWYALLTPPNKE